MGILKNENEVNYVGGKKHWTDIIKNSGPGELLVWRQPEEDFNTNSTLIVMPGETAIFIKSGEIEQIFRNGTYRLSTENYPFISRLRNASSGGISKFNCVVYFFREADSAEIYWGTDSPINVRDKVWGIRTDARARGSYKVRIEDPAKFLGKLVGNNIQFQTQKDLNKYFQQELQGKIKSAVSKVLNGLEQELIGIDAYLEEISQKIELPVDEMLDDYGLRCIRFALSGLDIDQTKYDDIDVSQVDLIKKQREVQGKRIELDALGNDWSKIQGVEILKDLANNRGAGGVAAMGAGIGMGGAAAGTFGTIAQGIFTPVTGVNGPTQQQANPYAPSGRFQQDQRRNEPSVSTGIQRSRRERLAELKEYLEDGLIEQSEYDKKIAEILKEI